MNDTMAKLRNTGRTSRMLEAAKRAHLAGRSVCVVMSTKEDENRARIKLGDVIRVVHSKSNDWNWNELVFRGLRQDTSYFIDHAAIERRFSTILVALHEFDWSEDLIA